MPPPGRPAPLLRLGLGLTLALTALLVFRPVLNPVVIGVKETDLHCLNVAHHLLFPRFGIRGPVDDAPESAYDAALNLVVLPRDPLEFAAAFAQRVAPPFGVSVPG